MNPRHIRPLQIMATMLMFSLVLYAGVLFVALPPNPSVVGEDARLYLSVFSFAALGSSVAIVAVRKRMLGTIGLGGGDQSEIIRARACDDATLQAELHRTLARYQTTTLVGMSLAEAVAVFGLVFGFLTTNISIPLVFIAAGLLLQLMQFPRLAVWRGLLSDPAKAALKMQP